MIKVICIDNSLFDKADEIPLIKGKIYDAYESLILPERWAVIDENGEKFSYYKKRFITLAEWREKQINKIFEDGEN